jgi:hypothetical protein
MKPAPEFFVIGERVRWAEQSHQGYEWHRGTVVRSAGSHLAVRPDDLAQLAKPWHLWAGGEAILINRESLQEVE